MIALLIIYILLIAFFAKVFINARREEKRLDAIYGPVYSAKKPTKKEIRERNNIDFLLMSEEMEEQIEKTNLDEHEKALA
jgi:hypothetical protein